MADADTEFDGNNMDEDTQLDSTLIKLAEQYVEYERKAKELNKAKADVREQAEKIGIPSLSFQHGVRMVKIMDKGERRDYQAGLRRVVKVLSEREVTLFPEEVEKRAKRKAEEAAKAGKAGAPDPDTNPRSDPKRGGAGKAKKRPTEEELSTAAANAPGAQAEQEEGAAVLDAGLPDTRSQSQIAQDARDKAGIA